MANKKISELASATTPLSGAELIEIVQSGTNKQVAASALIGAAGPEGDPGAPGADGLDGSDGADGRTVLSGPGAPSSGLGADGDFYIDTTDWDIYGPKTVGAWGAGTSLIGSSAANLATVAHAATSKTPPVDADELSLIDSAASYGLKKLTWANLKATIWSSLGALIAAGTAKTTPVDGDGIAIADSAASSATKYLTLANLWTNLFKGKADALYAVLAKGVTNGDSHDHSGGDGAQIAYSGLSGLPTLGTAAAKNTGASGDAVPLCNVANTFTAAQSVQGNLLVTSAANLGYGTGAGGTVTQATSKATTVSLNKPCGVITMHNASLAAGAIVSFQFLNSLFTTNDALLFSLCVADSSEYYNVWHGNSGAGYTYISVKNISAVSTNYALQLGFSIIKRATS